MSNKEYIRLTAQLAVLEDIRRDYAYKTIENIIQQLQSRLKG